MPGVQEARSPGVQEFRRPGDQVAFPRLAGAQPDEKVVFAWIVFQSREHRDQVNAKVMADPRIKALCDPAANPPFDFKRMAYGGFNVRVEA
jgi:uncharacterized protein YbaA (DUF1428 family)